MKNMEKLIKKTTKQKFSKQEDLALFLRKQSNTLKMKPPAKWQILEVYKKMVKAGQIKENKLLRDYLKKAAIRTSSGVSIITVLTKPYKCPGTCIYCPREPKMPVSYLSNEPAAQRANALKFDPIKMVQKRIQALQINGHTVDKIELLVLGGSFTAYTNKYQQDFVTKCFFAANTYGGRSRRKMKSLENEQKINEKARYKIIGVTLETRPDEITKQTVKNFRQLGCTRVQLVIQHTDDKILKLIKRGHTTAQSIAATKLLKDNGFKVDHHYMPDLPGSTPAKDLKVLKQVFTDPGFCPDQIKLYPCVVNEYAPLASWVKQGKHKPYTDKQLENLLFKIKKITPYWTRINRLIRDIPAESILAGNKVTNLRQKLQARLKKEGSVCKCIRCREVGLQNKTVSKPHKLFVQKYQASGGTEYFISYESKGRQLLYGFIRLRLNGQDSRVVFNVLKNSAIIRELHVYGQMVPVGAKLKPATQHKGLGKKLMSEAETIAKKHQFAKVSVISGVGVRDYYRKLGYRLQDTYMVKELFKK